MRRFAVLLLVASLVGCGQEPGGEATMPARTWSHVRIQGAESLSGMSVLGDELFAVNEANDRSLYVADLRTRVPGGELKARKLPLTVFDEAEIQGNDAFALQGYTTKHVWPLPVAFVGVAVRGSDQLYIAERSHRLIYWGDLTRGPGGAVQSAKLNYILSLRGGDRSQIAKSDWRDHSPGLLGLSPLLNDRRTEDLYAFDGDGGSPNAAGLRRLDRMGRQMGATLPIVDRSGKRPDLRGVVWEPGADRFLALVGGGRGALIPFQDTNIRTIHLGAGTPGPKIDGVTGWTSMALGDDGTLFLLSEGSSPVLAWRPAAPGSAKATK